MIRRALIAVVAALLLLPVAPTPASADDGGRDWVTASIVKRIDGRWPIGWTADALFQDRAYRGNELYTGPLNGEIVQIRPRYKREVGILHVPVDRKHDVVLALRGVWFARSGSRFVIPLRNETWTVGCRWQRPCANAARFAARKLGPGWVVVGPRGARS
jgi:hypothetical protein